MSRNIVVGGVLFGLVLAGLSVGIATFMSAQDIDMQAERISGVEGKVSSTEQQLTSDMQAFLPAAGGYAENLSTGGFLWSKGRLVVTHPEADGDVSFEVDPGASGSVKILSPLSVDADAVFADLSAGVATVNQVVVRNGIRDFSDAWVVDPAGNVKIAGDYTGKNLMVSGDFQAGGDKLRYDAANNRLLVEGRIVATEYTSGDDTAMLLVNSVEFNQRAFARSGSWSIEQDGLGTFDSLAAKALTVDTINSSSSPWWVTASGNAKLGALQAQSGAFGGAVTSGSLSTGALTSSGAATVGSLSTGALTSSGAATVGSLSTAGAVAAEGAVTGGSFSLKGGSPAFKVTSGGVLTAVGLNGASAEISGALTSGSLTTGDIVSTGTLDLDGKLTVNDEVWADAFQLNSGAAAFRVDDTGMTLGTAIAAASGSIANDFSVGGDLDVSGEITGTFVGDFDVNDKNIIANSLHGRNSLRSGPNAPYRFEVTGSGTSINGTLTVTGNSTFDGNVTVEGDTSVGGNLEVDGSVSVGGTALDLSSVPAFMRSGVASVNGGSSVVVTVTGMQSSDSVVITPRFQPTDFHYVTVVNGQFTIHGESGAYSWIVTR